jgi:hypothetical protein
MANIREQSTPGDLGLTPTDRGTSAFEGAARRTAAFYNAAGEAINDTGRRVASTITDAGGVIVKAVDHAEISHGAATFASLQADLTSKWNDTAKNSDPNDPGVAAKFREEVVEPALDTFKSNFNTERSQQFAEAKVESLRTHMFEKTAADQSTLAGIAVRKNINDSTTAMSNTAMLDPSSVPNLLKNVDHTIAEVVGSSPTLSATDAARATGELSDATKKAIVHAGAIGAIQKSDNPEATADAWIKKYPDVISGADAKTLAANARQQIRARNYDFETNRRREKEIAQDKSNEATSQYIIDVRSQDPKLANDPTAKKILNDPTLLKTDKNNLLNYIDRQLKPETATNLSQQTFVGLLREMRAPDADPDKVMQKAWDARLADPGKPGSLSEKDFNQFRAEIVARKTPEGAALEHDRAQFFKNYAAAISGQGIQYQPGVGDPKVYNAEMDARRVETDLRKKGLDPHLAYDPASEYFLGKPARISKWTQSMQQDLQTRATLPGNGFPQPKDIVSQQTVPAPVATATPRPAPLPPPEKGFVKDGYEFLGGNPGEAGSWRKVK